MRFSRCENEAYEDGERCNLPAHYKKHGKHLCLIHFGELVDQEIAQDRDEKAVVG